MINHQYDYSFDGFGYDYESQLNINPYLSRFYEFALAKRNKKNSPERKPLIDWNGSPENYIAYNNFISKYFFFTYLIGNLNSNCVSSLELVTFISPKCNSIIVFRIAKPNPVPSLLLQDFSTL